MYRLKILRFVKIFYIRESVDYIVSKVTGSNSNNKKFVKNFLTLVILVFLIGHILTCVWIFIGTGSVEEYKASLDSGDLSENFTWVFQP